MTFKDKMKLFWKKGKVIRVYLYHPDKRITEHVVNRPVGTEHKTFSIGEATYVVDPDKVFTMKGVPTLVYYVSEPDAVKPQYHAVQPLDKAGASDISSHEFYDAMEEKVSRDIIRYATKGDDELKKMMMISAAIPVIGVGVAGFLLYGEIDTIVTGIEELQGMQDTLEKLREESGGF